MDDGDALLAEEESVAHGNGFDEEETMTELKFLRTDVNRNSDDIVELRRKHTDLSSGHHSHEVYAQENGIRLFKLQQAMKLICDKIGVALPDNFMSSTL